MTVIEREMDTAKVRAWVSPRWRDYLVSIGVAEQDGATLYVSGPLPDAQGAVEEARELRSNLIRAHGVLLEIASGHPDPRKHAASALREFQQGVGSSR